MRQSSFSGKVGGNNIHSGYHDTDYSHHDKHEEELIRRIKESFASLIADIAAHHSHIGDYDHHHDDDYNRHHDDDYDHHHDDDYSRHESYDSRVTDHESDGTNHHKVAEKIIVIAQPTLVKPLHEYDNHDTSSHHDGDHYYHQDNDGHNFELAELTKALQVIFSLAHYTSTSEPLTHGMLTIGPIARRTMKKEIFTNDTITGESVKSSNRQDYSTKRTTDKI